MKNITGMQQEIIEAINNVRPYGWTGKDIRGFGKSSVDGEVSVILAVGDESPTVWFFDKQHGLIDGSGHVIIDGIA